MVAKLECDGCDQDPWTKPVHYGTCPLAPRPLHVIADEICKDWTKVYFGASPYLQAMKRLDKITGMYGEDSARDVVIYFLSNAATWRGETARRIKAELKGMLK